MQYMCQMFGAEPDSWTDSLRCISNLIEKEERLEVFSGVFKCPHCRGELFEVPSKSVLRRLKIQLASRREKKEF